MTSSIYHFFEDLYQRRSHLTKEKIKPDHFPYKDALLSLSGSRGQFPDLAIRINTNGGSYIGGELIEVKDSTSGYNISSFNSTIPSGTKPIQDIAPLGSKIYNEMSDAGDIVFSLLSRDVYYLLRGKQKKSVKICLVHGSFFETTSSNSTLKSAFEQVIDEAISDTLQYVNIDINDINDAKSKMLNLDWKQSHFSSVRRAAKSAISVRFRVMSEVVKEANLLNSSQYPSILDNTLNFVLPLTKIPNDEGVETAISNHMELLSGAFESMILPDKIKCFEIDHNIQKGWKYIVFQCSL